MAKQEDWWPSGRAAILVILGLATGTAVVQRPSGGASNTPGGASSPAAARPAPAGTPQGLSAARPVVAMLADAIGVDLESTRARETAIAWRDYLCIKMMRGANAADARVVAALDVILAGKGAPVPHVDAHPAPAVLRTPKAPDAMALLRAFARSDSVDAELKKDRAVMLEYLDDARHRPTLELVEDAAAGRGTRLDILIAMLPDYVDSQTRRLFDSGLGGIQQAAGALNYSLDRFYLPDWSASGAAPSGDTLAHEAEPGALLFRSIDPHYRDRLLLVLVVTEMPTLGVHRGALSSAIAFVDAWHAATQRRQRGPVEPRQAPLTVLGPFFSGSLPSLQDTLQSLDVPGLPRSVQIITGSATDPTIGERLRSVSLGGERVQFDAIVPNSRQVITTLLEYLGSINNGWSCVDGVARVAVLVEGNTAFGVNTMSVVNRPAANVESDTNATTTAQCRPALQITFPLHVSRLRGALDAGPPGPSLLSPPAIRLKLSETAQPKDLVPAFTPEMTASVVDSAIDNSLTALKRERYSAIGIVATDARDHLFLARKIARIVPNVQMFGTQSDLLYINPEYAPFLRGTVIASSYPLFNQTQLLTGTPEAAARRQFTTASEQGTYNATILLLQSMLGDDRHARQLVDATPRAAHCFGKPCAATVWLSVVGSDGLWPLGDVRGEETAPRAAKYTVTMAPSWVVAAALAVFGAAAAHMLGLWFVMQDRRALERVMTAKHHGRPADLVAKLQTRCHWQHTRALWNLFPPSHVARPPGRPVAPRDEVRS